MHQVYQYIKFKMMLPSKKAHTKSRLKFIEKDKTLKLITSINEIKIVHLQVLLPVKMGYVPLKLSFDTGRWFHEPNSTP